MLDSSSLLSPAAAKAFYDRFGIRQDAQSFYEDVALDDLVGHLDLDRAQRLLEFGCGTGRLAARLLADELPPDARYAGLDISDAMVALAAGRLARFGPSARVQLADGSTRLPFPDGAFDRVISTYVMDLLPETEIVAFLAEARRVLAPDGRLGLVGLTRGRGLLARIVSSAWAAVHAFRPAWVGGCRPLAVAPVVSGHGFTLVHHGLVSAWCVSSEVVVASPA